jgi:AraC-like DNA-binding protein
MSRAVEESNRRMLRARDAMDREYAKPLDIPTLAGIAYVSEAHFIRTFRATFGETPHRYLQRRRVERPMFLLRERRGVLATAQEPMTRVRRSCYPSQLRSDSSQVDGLI